ncbi:hypothetical protein ACTHQN_12970 [Curtobacterium flaccumfaciens]|uniref:hypothetical protein n=1 Tax=Curtobacterium flaccumfaciens TaxID=2035 RepID=UPI003F7F9516
MARTPAVALRPTGVQTVVVADIAAAVEWWAHLTQLHAVRFVRAGDLAAVHLAGAEVGRARTRLVVLSGPGAEEAHVTTLRHTLDPVLRQSIDPAGRAVRSALPIADPWANTVLVTARPPVHPGGRPAERRSSACPAQDRGDFRSVHPEGGRVLDVAGHLVGVVVHGPGSGYPPPSVSTVSAQSTGHRRARTARRHRPAQCRSLRVDRDAPVGAGVIAPPGAAPVPTPRSRRAPGSSLRR